MEPRAVKNRRTWLVVAVLSLAATGDLAGQAVTVDRAVLAGGGGVSTGAEYRIEGTIGQALADHLSMCSPDGGALCVNPAYEVTSGFWVPLSASTPIGNPTCGNQPDCLFRSGFENEVSP